MLTAVPPAIARSSWGARPPRRPAEVLRPTFAVVHHTTGRNDYAPHDVPALLREIQDLHMESNGWDDIGYNLVVDRFGRVFAGRSGIGAHARGHNGRALGIALLGDFSHAPPSPAAQRALREAGGALALVAHRELDDTECPGAAWQDLPRLGPAP